MRSLTLVFIVSYFYRALQTTALMVNTIICLYLFLCFPPRNTERNAICRAELNGAGYLLVHDHSVTGI